MASLACSIESSPKPIIEIRDLRKVYGVGEGAVVALDDIRLSIAPGEMIAIVGASGSGKSTLMNILGCLDVPTNGSYTVAGRNTRELEPDELAELRREHFGFIFQRYHLLSDLTAIGNVELPAIYAGQGLHLRHRRASLLLERLGLGDRVAHRPTQLSGGEQQRVSIARALMNGGEIILADEPTGALDSRNGLAVLDLLKELHREGHTVIIITHDIGIAKHASRIVELRDGRMVADRRSGDPSLHAASRPRIRDTVRRSWISTVLWRTTEVIPLAWRTVRSHPLRTLLTMLGIIIGVAAVIAVLAIGEGSRERILKEISELGTNTISVYPGKGWGDEYADAIDTLIPADVEAFRLQSYVDSATPEVASNDVVVVGKRSANATINGVSEDYFRVSGLKIDQGTGFARDSVDRGLQIAVIGANARSTLFPDESNPIGRTLLVRRTILRVVGVASPRTSSFFGVSRTPEIYVPYTTMLQRLTGPTKLSGIRVRTLENIPSTSAEAAISRLLIARHGRRDFFTLNSNQVRATAERATQIMTFLISAVASISLLVGGIGIMNIMLVSIIERRREIGLRIAVGARQIDILFQFLTEALVICIAGAIVGVSLAILCGWAMVHFVTGIRMIFSIKAILLACGVAIGTGLIFGYLPARNAARLDPVAALERD